MVQQLGWLDTPIFVHVLFPRDTHHDRCRAILAALEQGRAEGWLDILVVHELTYVLPRTALPRFRTREGVHEYIRGILLAETIHASDKESILAGLGRWAVEGIGFADARLTTLARREDLPVCSVNAADFPDTENTFFTANV